MTENISVTLKENRLFQPPAEFLKACRMDKEAISKLEAFTQLEGDQYFGKYWENAAESLTWEKKWNQTLDWQPPFAKWFIGGELNASVNCIDRHLELDAHKAAITWEGEPGEVVTWTYSELHFQVERLAAVLRKLGLKKGDTAAIYMPLLPESVAAMLACARIGVVHTVIFGGFSGESLKDRVNDAGAKIILTANFGWRKGQKILLKDQVESVIEKCPTVKNLLLLQREKVGIFQKSSSENFDWKSFTLDWSVAVASLTKEEHQGLGKPVSLPAEHPLFILYTSGTTGKPKGIVHSTGGYLTGVLRSTELVFDLKPSDLYWCTADIGWITGHSYVVYGPLALGASIFLYEGAPGFPSAERFWEMIERHRINIFYTAPTAIRSFIKQGKEVTQKCDLSSLRLLGSVGEPINPEAWMWYHENIGNQKCPIVDTYWQTETGSIVISPIPARTPTAPGSATLPLPGYEVDVVDRNGRPVPTGQGGFLVIKNPWPSMARNIHGDPERFKKQYFGEFNGADGLPIYFTGDGARRDENGYIWCLGRVDDVLNVSGHRLGTMEIESALVSNLKVAEAAVVGRADDLKGQSVVAFVTLKSEFSSKDTSYLALLKKELQAHVVKEIGALARPDEIRFTEQLPKTRSGKIMRRLLREIAQDGKIIGDTTTLEDLSVLSSLSKNLQSEEE